MNDILNFWNLNMNKRAEILSTWCNSERGRSSKLSVKLTGKPYNISHYKSGKINISDELWKKMIEAMKLIENSGNDTGEISSKKSLFLQSIDIWLSKNTMCKLRLANVVYVHNFLEHKDYSLTPFTDIIENTCSLSEDEAEKINDVIMHVNKMIENKSPFAVAASLSPK